MLSNQEGKLRNEYVKDYILFDLETTGVSCNTDDVVEISALKIQDEKIVGEFSTLVNPGRPIPHYATDVNGITDDMVADAPDFKTALTDFLDFIGDLPLVGHNIRSFDMKFIYRDCQKYFGQIPDNDLIDTLRLSRSYLPQLEGHKLMLLCKHYNISTEGAHRALSDCRMNQKVYYRLGQEMTPEAMQRNGLIACKKCGAVMKLRNGKFGEFLGCSNYPACRSTMNIPDGYVPVGKKESSKIYFE